MDLVKDPYPAGSFTRSPTLKSICNKAFVGFMCADWHSLVLFSVTPVALVKAMVGSLKISPKHRGKNKCRLSLSESSVFPFFRVFHSFAERKATIKDRTMLTIGHANKSNLDTSD